MKRNFDYSSDLEPTPNPIPSTMNLADSNQSYLADFAEATQRNAEAIAAMNRNTAEMEKLNSQEEKLIERVDTMTREVERAINRLEAVTQIQLSPQSKANLYKPPTTSPTACPPRWKPKATSS